MLIGVNPTLVTAEPMFTLGQLGSDVNGKVYVWVQANGAITGAGYAVQISEAFQAAMTSTTGDAAGDLIGVPAAAFADNDYGWVQVWGACVVRVAASAAANVLLNTTATAGQLDDDGAASAMVINGLVLTTANGGAAATAAAMLNYPSIGKVGGSFITQGAPAAETVTAALTAADLVGGIITTTGATGPSEHQLPTGTQIDAALPDAGVNYAFDFYIINTGTGASDDATITVNTDVTIVGNPTVGALTDGTIISGSGHFRARRTAAHVWVVYRLA